MLIYNIKMNVKNKLVVFLGIGLFFIFPNFCSGTIINEIAWMGTETSASDEWIELYNNTDQDIDLTGWTLKALDDRPEITLEGTIAANGYFLLERTDDSSVSDIAADQIYTGALGNSGESLELRNTENTLIDSLDFTEGWPTGDNSTKQTMERTDTGWQTSLEVGGTPKTLNSSGEETPPEEEPPAEEPEVEGWIPATTTHRPPVAHAGSDTSALVNQEIFLEASQSYDPDNDPLTYFWNFGDGATDTQEKTSHTYLYPGQYIVSLMVSDEEFSDLDIIIINIYSPSIIISEFMPVPTGSDEENEWIELFNQSSQIANLTGWQLDDQEGNSPPFLFPANSLIGPEQFLVLRRPVSQIALNNDNDQVRLICPDGSIAAEVSYLAENKEGLAIAFDGQDYFWTEIPTPGTTNIISSIDLENESKNLSANNPQPIIQETQDLPEILAQTNLNQSQEFSALNPIAAENELTTDQPTKLDISDLKEQAPAALGQTVRTSSKANLILLLSIIIAGSLLASWLLIRLKKRIS